MQGSASDIFSPLADFSQTYGGFHGFLSHVGYPKMDGFIRENPNPKWMIKKGVTRMMEKQGSFGQVPNSRFAEIFEFANYTNYPNYCNHLG